MSHERLAQLIHTHQDVLRTHPEARTPLEAILGILGGLDTETITLRQALRLLSYQALRLDDAPAHQTLYRQAAVALLQMQQADQAAPGLTDR